MESGWPRRRRAAIAVGWVGVFGAVLGGAHVHAQQRPGVMPVPAQPAAVDEEVGPKLVLGPGGEVFRLWQRRADARAGGGAAILARATPGGGWETVGEIRSTEEGVTIRDPEVAVSRSGELAVVYRWWRHQPRAKQLRLARSDDGGKTWSRSPVPIDTAEQAFDPNAAWTGEKDLVVVWADERRGRRLFDVYSRRSGDGGRTWEAEQVLSHFDPLLPGDLFARPQLVGDGQGRLWTVWVGLKGGRSSVYMNRSVDGGRTWSEPRALTGESQSVFGYSLHSAGDRLLLVWHDARTQRDRLYAVTSGDAGVTWTEPVRIDNLPADAQVDTVSPSAVLGPDGEALVAWSDTRNGRHDIFLARSTDGGRTWGADNQRMDMDEVGTAVSQYPRLARAADGRVALVWEDDRAGFEGVYLRVRSAGDGREWGAERLLSSPGSKLASRLPQVLWAPAGTLHVAWEVWEHAVGLQVATKRVDGKALRVE